MDTAFCVEAVEKKQSLIRQMEIATAQTPTRAANLRAARSLATAYGIRISTDPRQGLLARQRVRRRRSVALDQNYEEVYLHACTQP
jgi:hypothetical protein